VAPDRRHKLLQSIDPRLIRILLRGFSSRQQTTDGIARELLPLHAGTLVTMAYALGGAAALLFRELTLVQKPGSNVARAVHECSALPEPALSSTGLPWGVCR
jgi:hypothetical protein